MKDQPQTQRARRRKRSRIPIGLHVGLLAAACITLIGVALGLEPAVILTRAVLSATILGSLVSFGTSVLGLTNAKNQKSNQPRR